MVDNILIIVAVCLVGGAMAWAFLVHINLFKHYHYVCVKCRTSYKPNTFLQSIFGLNGGDQRKLKCPNCNKREWANTIKDNSRI